MRRYAEIYGLAVVVLVAVTPVHAAPVDFFATVSGAAENPSNSSPATGTAHVAFDLTTHLLHVATPPTNAIVATTTPTFPDFPLGVMSGTYDRTLDTSTASSFNSAFIAAHDGMVASAEAAPEFPSGETRGLLLTPEAGTVLLLGLGLAGLALLLKRRRRGR